MPVLSACWVCAIVCILLLEDSISDSNQPDNNNCDISRRSSLLKEGIIKDGLSNLPYGNLFLDFFIFLILKIYPLFNII